MEDEDFALVLRALGHPARLNILRILAKNRQNCCCADVTQCLPLAQSTVSQHIKVLLEAGLIERKSQGTKNCYVVMPQKLDALESAFGALARGLLKPSGQQ